MNIKNMRKLLRQLQSPQTAVGFSMSNWFRHNEIRVDDPEEICDITKNHPCGTVACLAGHAAILAWESGDVDKSPWGASSIRDAAQEWLDLPDATADRLFMGNWPGTSSDRALQTLTKAEAIIELNRMINETPSATPG